jgi:hypothetical protein
MSSASYFPPPVRQVDIPKGDSGFESGTLVTDTSQPDPQYRGWYELMGGEQRPNSVAE